MTDSINTSVASKDSIAQVFAETMRGRIEPHLVEAGVQAIKSADGGYPAAYNGNGVITITGGQTFNCVGGCYPGYAQGTIGTQDVNQLYSNTTNYWWSSQSGTLYFWFFDAASNTLGTFTASPVDFNDYDGSGGTGSWS